MDIPDVAREKAALEMMGIVRARVEKPAQAGGKFAYVTFSDPTGEFEAMVPPETLMEIRDLIEPGASVVVRVRPRIRDEEIRLIVDGVVPLDKASLGAPKGLLVALEPGAEPAAIAAISRQLEQIGTTERGEIRLQVELDGGRHAIVSLPGKYAVSTGAAQLLKASAGVRSVKEIAA
jgi:DNA polymerase III subunit alpha